MSDEISMLIKRAIEGEIYASEAFIQLAGKGEKIPHDIIYHLLTYAQQEIEHAKKLIQLATEQDIELKIDNISSPKIEDILSFIIEYRAQEESGIFYYDTLLSYELDEETQKTIKEIRDEELNHFNFLNHLLEESKK